MWKPVDTEFFAPRTPVEIVDCGGVGSLGRLARDLIEELGGTAHLHLCGTPGDFLKVIAQGERAAPYLIITAHGDDNGLVFGEYADSIDTSMLVEGSMPPECVAKHIDLPGRVVFNDACRAGEPPMAQAFMAGGLKGYIGSREPTPHGTAGIMFIAHFFYKLWREKCSEREAWEQAASYDKDSRLYVYWDADGGHWFGYAESACTAETFPAGGRAGRRHCGAVAAHWRGVGGHRRWHRSGLPQQGLRQGRRVFRHTGNPRRRQGSHARVPRGERTHASHCRRAGLRAEMTSKQVLRPAGVADGDRRPPPFDFAQGGEPAEPL